MKATNQNKDAEKKMGLDQPFMQCMAIRMMERCPCRGMFEHMKAEDDKESEGTDAMTQWLDAAGAGGICAAMMAACCGGQPDPGEQSQGA